jgi:RecT family protein
MGSADIATVDTTDMVARVAGGTLTTAEQVLINRLVKVRQGQSPPSREELALVVGEALHMGLDVFARQCYFIKFDDGPGGAWECFPHWSGLVKIAEETGEYLGHRGPFYSADGKQWSRAWLPDDPPPLCMVTVLRRDHEPTTVVLKFKRWARYYTKNGQRRLMPQWETNPEEQLGKQTLRIALRRAFPKEADKGLSKAQLRALHTLASLKGLGGAEKRPKRLAEVSEIVGREVDSFTDLSVAEASEVYETLAEELGEVLPDDVFGDEDLPEMTPDVDADVVGGDRQPPESNREADGEQSGTSSPAHPPAAASEPDDPQELAELRKKGVDEFRVLSSRLPAEWRPWFRNNVEEIEPGAWEGSGSGNSWPRSFNVAQMRELFERLERVRPWGEAEQAQ